MNFTSPLFLTGFPVVCLIYRKLPEHKASGLLSRRTFLLLASWLFYMGGSLLCFPLLFLVTLITYLGGISIEKACAETKDRAKAILALVLFFVLSILFFFKYFGFVQDTLFRLTGMKGRGLLLPLPAGISFYSFQSLSYCLDVYRGRRAAERSFRDFALYVSFFPQLVAGPIERADDLLPQLKACPSPTGSDTRTGAFFILRGFFKKIVIADFISVYVSALFNAERCSGPLTILAGILFGFQIYADFSGYSDIALGAARLLGIRLHMNFDRPYLADSIREFWRRWHITLTSWFTDYVYIPLGGSRRGTAVHVRNILIVFLLSGFWHGADWHFAAWGLYHGILLSLGILWAKAHGTKSERAHADPAGIPAGRSASGSGTGHSPVRLIRIALTFLLTSLGWVLFRAASVRQAFSMYAVLAKGWTEPDVLRAAFIKAGAPLGMAVLIRIALIPVLLYQVRAVPAQHDIAQTSGASSSSAGDVPDRHGAAQTSDTRPSSAGDVPDGHEIAQTSDTRPSSAGDVPDRHGAAEENDRILLLMITAFLMAAAVTVAWIGNLAGGTGNDFIYFQF